MNVDERNVDLWRGRGRFTGYHCDVYLYAGKLGVIVRPQGIVTLRFWHAAAGQNWFNDVTRA